ncbi:MAG: hypothetical protein AAF770_01415 [Bacteroidota bacterium]
MLEQKEQVFSTRIPPKNIIVSLFQPYLQPIVRGKKVKKVAFAAKVNKMQVDGINFIQRLSFEPLNKRRQCKGSIYQAQQLTKRKVRKIGVDAIDTTNTNRELATAEEITTDFVRKGRAGKNEKQTKQMASTPRKERASFL